MGRYWRVTAETMLCGMDRDEVFECEDEKKAHEIAAMITSKGIIISPTSYRKDATTIRRIVE